MDRYLTTLLLGFLFFLLAYFNHNSVVWDPPISHPSLQQPSSKPPNHLEIEFKENYTNIGMIRRKGKDQTTRSSTIGKNGQIYVAFGPIKDISKSSAEVVVFSYNGSVITSFGSDVFHDPIGIVSDSEGNLLLCDRTDNLCREFSPDTFKVISDFPVDSPLAIAISKTGYIYVLSSKPVETFEAPILENSLSIFSKNKTLLHTVTHEENPFLKNLEFGGMTTDSNDNLVIVSLHTSHQHNRTIGQFSTKGQFSTLFEFDLEEAFQEDHPDLNLVIPPILMRMDQKLPNEFHSRVIIGKNDEIGFACGNHRHSSFFVLGRDGTIKRTHRRVHLGDTSSISLDENGNLITTGFYQQGLRFFGFNK